MDDAKLREILTALLEEMRNSKVQISDVLAQRSEYAADIRDLKASIDTTRRALDPEALGANVAENNDAFMGDLTQKFAKAIQLSLDAGRATQNAAGQTEQAAQSIKDHADSLKLERNALAAVARHLEERDQRSKWDWVTLAAGMAVAALLAGGGAVYFTKQQLDTANFQDAIRLIQNDDRNYWCGTAAQSPVITDREGLSYCAVQMPEYQVPEEGGDPAGE